MGRCRVYKFQYSCRLLTWMFKPLRTCMSPYWHLADIQTTLAFVRFWTTADKGGFRPEMVCPLMTQSGHRLASRPAPFQCANLRQYDALSLAAMTRSDISPVLNDLLSATRHRSILGTASSGNAGQIALAVRSASAALKELTMGKG
jgi:hypothetical protein